ncbi:efflux RND transporter permease subunit [Psychromonas sp. KJ10-10]|uniref:efflux RND transporter permease subunit n=1 Tax=Psychromonas sp. KJ10-10 TaxID=3391823 RepID=UPI0039B641E7
MIAFFMRHPTLANLMMMTFFVLGLTCMSTLKRETFPDFSPPYIIASVIYPGASPAEVEGSLCLRMEDAVDGLSNIEEIKCDAQEGIASLTLKLNDDADLGRTLIDVQTEINAINDFPVQIEAPTVKELDWAEPVVDLAISAQASLPHLKAYAEDVKRRLKIEADVSLVNVSGFSSHQLRVALNLVDLRRLGLTVNDIATKISRQNIKMPVGNIELTEKNLLIRFDQQQVNAHGLSQTIVASTAEGGVVRLGDISQIKDLFELEEERIVFNGEPRCYIKNTKK